MSCQGAIDPFTERKASWVIEAKFVCSNTCFFKKLFHVSHLGAPSNSCSYSLKISSKFMETTQHLPKTQGFEILTTFSAWTLLNLCASFTNCALLRVSYSITSLYLLTPAPLFDCQNHIQHYIRLISKMKAPRILISSYKKSPCRIFLRSQKNTVVIFHLMFLRFCKFSNRFERT